MQKLWIWKEMAIYIGPSFSTKRHSHFFIQLCLGNKEEFRLKGSDGNWYSYKAALIPSGVSHETEMNDRDFVLILLDPITMGTGLFADRNLTPGKPAIEVGDVFDWEKIRFFFEASDVPPENLKAEIAKRIFENGTGKSITPKDIRIIRSMKSLSDSEDTLTLQEVAKEAGLSPSRFRHLFRKETGITFSGYRLWIKTRRAILSLGNHPELIHAAYQGGFADQAHFSRIFRRSFGMSPSEFVKGKALQTFRIFPT
ncbi:helix-turn-helix transcriptional regulator [Leptospira sp. 201903070]|uniref:Helix-turn-helix transcriptional regulator n=1 Tax=Leptospira ainlahdjerensis TaxID=2810033 RepID=A0ABS2UG16_9LEPT|nr:helix-turn-helix transcriptional regulator [Leptospira ainlahdjerensis]MBM9578498.1 helix-turn-helix transcriptional regulator [Leptospira ainlahdjerensis]